MPTRSSKPRDHAFATAARRVVEQAIGEKLTGKLLEDTNAGKNPAAVALGEVGRGKRGNGTSGGAITRQTEGDSEKSG